MRLKKEARKIRYAGVTVGSWWMRRRVPSTVARGDAHRPRCIESIQQEGVRVFVMFADYRRPIAVESLIAQYEPCEAPVLVPATPEPGEPPARPALDALVGAIRAALLPEIREAVRRGIDDAFETEK
jgi:hypothetical protein